MKAGRLQYPATLWCYVMAGSGRRGKANSVTMEKAGIRRAGLLGSVAAVFPRVIAICLVFFALQYWMRLIGFHDGPEFRFDTMPEHWRIAAASLAVLFPVAALGLWGGFSWGIVVWVLAAAIEIAMHTWFAGLFGRSDYVVGFHLATLTLFAALTLVARLARRPAKGR